MKIAFYAPLKAPSHPVPSGDRLMARALMACLQAAGHQVEVASELRAFLGDPADEAGLALLEARAAAEVARITALWQQGAPDLWFCYHPYYKAPDLLGPSLSDAFGLCYVTAECSYSARRSLGIWAGMQAQVLAGVRRAEANICLTERDRRGLAEVAPGARLARLRPFIDTAGFDAPPVPEAGHLVTVAMMRAGDKFDSYARLAAALTRIDHLPWVLSVAGDGPLRAEVEALFANFGPGRVEWHGLLDRAGVAALLARGAIYLWPGCGEAYGLAYLEAQAAGLPVVAFDTAGVPEVVASGETGFLVPFGDDAGYAAAVASLLADGGLQGRMALAARVRARRDHSTAGAVTALDGILRAAMAGGA